MHMNCKNCGLNLVRCWAEAMKYDKDTACDCKQFIPLEEVCMCKLLDKGEGYCNKCQKENKGCGKLIWGNRVGTNMIEILTCGLNDYLHPSCKPNHSPSRSKEIQDKDPEVNNLIRKRLKSAEKSEIRNGLLRSDSGSDIHQESDRRKPLSDKRKDLLKRFKEVPLCDVMPLIQQQDAEAVRKLKEELLWCICESHFMYCNQCNIIDKIFGVLK